MSSKLLVLRQRTEVLCFKRNRVLCGFRPDYVVFPGGGIDQGESPHDAAVREAAEEARRVVQNLTVAHAPTVQFWPDGMEMEDAPGAVGGYTHWFTGSTSEDVTLPEHPDFEAALRWHSIEDVLSRLTTKGFGKGWEHDTMVRVTVLRSHLMASKTSASTGSSILAEPVRFGRWH